MNKRHSYVAAILFSFLPVGIQPAFATTWIIGPDQEPPLIPPVTIGTWNGNTRTFTLAGDTPLGDNIQIIDDNLTLDGAGYKVDLGGSLVTGVNLAGRQYVTIQNVNVTKCGAGITLNPSGYCNVINNTVSDCQYGIFMSTAGTCTIEGNTVSDNINGIWLQSGSINHTLNNNTIKNNNIGIYIQNSSNNTLIDNTASNNTIGIRLQNSSGDTLTDNNAEGNTDYGIELSSSTGNTLTGNIVSGNGQGIRIFGPGSIDGNNNLTNNNASNNIIGIRLYEAESNTLTSNTVTSNTNSGIYLTNSHDNTVKENTASNNDTGIKLNNSSNNTLTNNNVSNNTLYGIWLDPSNDNQIYNNNFIANTTQAEVVDGTGNVFNLDPPIGGNYWSDWDPETGPNYIFTGGQDNEPWAVQDGWLDTTPPIISCPGNTAIVGPDGVPVDDERIQTFLAGASATDNCDPEPTITNNAPDVFPPGDTVVTFTATDASGNSSSCSSTVTVVDTESHLRIIPSIINREGRLEKVLAVIRFPEGTTEEDIDIGQKLILYPGDSLNGIEAINQRIVTWYIWGTLRVSVFASFSKDEVTADVPDGLVEMMVIGRFVDSADGEYFYGFDNVWIISWDWSGW